MRGGRTSERLCVLVVVVLEPRALPPFTRLLQVYHRFHPPGIVPSNILTNSNGQSGRVQAAESVSPRLASAIIRIYYQLEVASSSSVLCPSQSLHMAYVPCKLAKYFVFNPVKFGLREENDFEKIFYYWPSGRDLGEQMMDVGLCEALVHLPKCDDVII